MISDDEVDRIEWIERSVLSPSHMTTNHKYIRFEMKILNDFFSSFFFFFQTPHPIKHFLEINSNNSKIVSRIIERYHHPMSVPLLTQIWQLGWSVLPALGSAQLPRHNSGWESAVCLKNYWRKFGVTGRWARTDGVPAMTPCVCLSRSSSSHASSAASGVGILGRVPAGEHL